MRQVLWESVSACLVCLALVGCDTFVTGGGGQKSATSPVTSPDSANPTAIVAAPPSENASGQAADAPAESGENDSSGSGKSVGTVQLTRAETGQAAATPNAGPAQPASETVTAAVDHAATPPATQRTFQAEGPGGALRISFDDLDLLKLLKMEPVTPDCVEKMPTWLRELNGKPIRIRGFMKPGLLSTGIPQFLLVRDTGLCCFGPAGKIYDLIAVTLAEGTTTDYIELRPFDVVGTFRIQLEILEDENLIFGLYYIDNAKIIQK